MTQKVIIGAILFLIVGEILVRVDQKLTFLSSNSVVRIATTIGQSPEYTSLCNHTLDTSSRSLRILVLGDSYIHGGGIEFKNNFSQQLKVILDSKIENLCVLDVSVPSSNSLDNLNSYLQFSVDFRPDIVILGYNYNDVVGNLDKDTTSATALPNKTTLKATNSNKHKSTAKKIYDVLFQSKLLNYALTNANEKLKSHGVIIPGSELDNVLKAYTTDKPSWEKSKALLGQMIADAKQKNCIVVAMKFPEMNLLEHPAIFNQTDTIISGFFSQFDNVRSVNVGDIFKGEQSSAYLLSRYDGHPNELAHKKIATFMAAQLSAIPAVSKHKKQ